MVPSSLTLSSNSLLTRSPSIADFQTCNMFRMYFPHTKLNPKCNTAGYLRPDNLTKKKLKILLSLRFKLYHLPIFTNSTSAQRLHTANGTKNERGSNSFQISVKLMALNNGTLSSLKRIQRIN